MKKLAVAFVAFASLVFMAQIAAAENRDKVFVQIDYSKWDSGTTHSWGYGPTAGYSHKFGDALYALPSVQMSGGIQNINGAAFQAPTFGFALSSEFGYTIPGASQVTPFTSVHFAWDDYSLNDEWYRIYTKVGVSAVHGKMSYRGGLILPIFTQVDATIWNPDGSSRLTVTDFKPGADTHSDVVLKLRNKPSYFAEIAYAVSPNFTIGLNYEVYLFGASNSVVSADGRATAKQQDTSNQKTGVRMSWLF